LACGTAFFAHDLPRKFRGDSQLAVAPQPVYLRCGRKSWIWVAATKKLAFLQVAMSRGRDALERYLATVDDWKPYR